MKYASRSAKALPLFCLTITLIVSLVLFLTRNHRYIGKFPSLLKDHRNVIQVIIQVLASVLSLAQMLVVTSLINFAARIRLFETPTTVNILSFWSALLIPRFDRSLPSLKLGLVTLVLALGTVLGALWAGSLTPLSVVTSRNDGSVWVPCFNTTLEPTIYAASGSGAIVLQCNNNETADPRGPSYPPLDNCIVMNKLGNLIMTAATATNVTNPRQHPKIDNSTWTYKGRSYGKGSLAGLFDVSHTTLRPRDIGFSFQESGYNIQASCQSQNSTVLSFQPEDNNTEVGEFQGWIANNVTLESESVSIPPFHLVSPTYNRVNSRPFGYFAWSAFTHNGTHNLATASQNNTWSQTLEQLLCTIEFVPWIFSVNISRAEQSVSVTPLKKIENFNQTSNIADMISIELDLVSRFSSSSIAFSSLFEAMTNNLRAARIAYHDLDNNTIWEYTMRDVMSEIMDDLLTYHGILSVSDNKTSSISQPVQRHFAAVQVGQQPYQIAQLVINVVLCTVCLAEVYRTRYWKQLPEFDFLDIHALIMAALGPGSPDGHHNARPSRSPIKWRKMDDRKVMAFNDEPSGTRLFFSDGIGEMRRLTSVTESSLHLLDDIDRSQSHRSTVQDLESESSPHVNLLSPNEDVGSPQPTKRLSIDASSE